jgi:hypothetical protein
MRKEPLNSALRRRRWIAAALQFLEQGEPVLG